MANSGSNTSGPNGFVYLWRDIQKRTTTPFKHVTFWVYLIIGVVLCGGLGVWLEFIRFMYSTKTENPASLLVALITFFPALVGSSALQLVFGGDKKGMRSFALLVAVIFGLVACWLAFGPPDDFKLTIKVAVGFSLFGIWVWWIANGLDPAFQDDLDMNAPLGGQVTGQLPGNLTDYTQ